MDIQHSPDTPYLRARHTVMTILNMRFFKVWLQPDCLFNLTSYAKQQKESIDLTHKFTDEVNIYKEARQLIESSKERVRNSLYSHNALREIRRRHPDVKSTTTMSP